MLGDGVILMGQSCIVEAQVFYLDTLSYLFSLKGFLHVQIYFHFCFKNTEAYYGRRQVECA